MTSSLSRLENRRSESARTSPSHGASSIRSRSKNSVLPVWDFLMTEPTKRMLQRTPRLGFLRRKQVQKFSRMDGISWACLPLSFLTVLCFLWPFPSLLLLPSGRSGYLSVSGFSSKLHISDLIVTACLVPLELPVVRKSNL